MALALKMQCLDWDSSSYVGGKCSTHAIAEPIRLQKEFQAITEQLAKAANRV